MPDTKEDFTRHLSRLGFELEVPREWIQKKFRRHVGEVRFAELKSFWNEPPNRERSHRIYDSIRDFTEANLFRSLDPDVTAEASYHLYQKCRPLLTPGKRLIELGCWTGGLASFIAENHPQVQVLGVDRATRIIEINRAQYKLPNLQFEAWDYHNPKPESVAPADILLCSLGIHNLPNGGYEEPELKPLRNTAGHRAHKLDAAIYFKNWRAAANPDAYFFAVLRIATFGRFIAFIDAAQETRWQLELRDCANVHIPGAKEYLPSLVWVANNSTQISEDDALAHFVRLSNVGDRYAQLSGGLALAVYRSIANERVLHKRSYENDRGFVTHEEIGIAGAYGYRFGHDSQPAFRLVLTSTESVRALQEKLKTEMKQTSGAAHFGGGTFVVDSAGGFGGSGFGDGAIPPMSSSDSRISE